VLDKQLVDRRFRSLGWMALCFLLAYSGAGLTLAMNRPLKDPAANQAWAAKLTQDALRELFQKRANDAAIRELVAQRSAIAAGGGTLRQDGFPSVLAGRLLQEAAAGTLFVESADKISLRLSWDYGDDQFWYVGVVSAERPDGTAFRASGPWVMWQFMGIMVTPNGPDDNPSLAHYALDSVSAGDVVQFYIYRLPRETITSRTDIDPVAVVDGGRGRMILRLSLPVIISPARADPPKGK